MRTINAKKHQTLFDIALQEYGDAQGVFWLVEDNGLLGVVDTLKDNQPLKIRPQAVNAAMRDYLRPYEIATGETARGQGVGFWFVQDDFVIS